MGYVKKYNRPKTKINIKRELSKFTMKLKRQDNIKLLH